MPEIDLASRIFKDPIADQAITRTARIELARRAAKRKDILMWGACLMPDKFKLRFCYPLHGYFISIRLDPRTNTEAPRNHAKTLIKCNLIPMFQALEETEMFDYYLNVQATKVKALAVNTGIRMEIETNDMIQEIYGNVIGEDKWSDQQFVLKNGIVFTAISAGESIRGIQYRNKRPKYIVTDDLYDEDDINNPDSTKKKTDWFWGSLYPARDRSSRCSIHVQGTAINKYTIIEDLKKNKSWKSATFKAIVDEDKKQVLWPDLNSFESLMQDKQMMGSIIFNREMQNELQDEKESKVKRSWLTNWEFDPNELFSKLAKGKDLKLSQIIIGNDPSIGKNTEADDNGIAVVFVTMIMDGSRKDYWIYELSAEKLSLEERKKKLETLAASLPPNMNVSVVKIEAISAFDDFATFVTNKTNLPVERISHVKDKLSTLENKSHHFENGRVHLNKNIGYTSDGRNLKEMIIEQLTNNYPRHDDVRDAVLLCLDDESGLWSFV